jgi:hypothetical protein
MVFADGKNPTIALLPEVPAQGYKQDNLRGSSRREPFLADSSSGGPLSLFNQESTT